MSGFADSHPIEQANGHAPPSFVADILTDPESLARNGKHSENMMQDIKWAAGSLFAGKYYQCSPTRGCHILIHFHEAGVETVR